MMNPRAERFNAAVKLWFELTGTEDGKGFKFKDLDVWRMNERLKESMDLDSTLITSFLIFSAYADSYFSDRVVSIKEMMNDPIGTADYMAKVAEFLTLLHGPDIIAIADDFAAKMRQAVTSYDAASEAAMKVIDDRFTLGFLRRDALRSLEKNLSTHQFLRGEPEADAIKPGYDPMVRQYWNINSLIEGMLMRPSGVSLNLIRDPDDMQSYFVFAIRNGGNVFIFTDVEKEAHPLAASMSRRADKTFDARAARNWFPYGLLDIKASEDGHLYVDKSEARGLVVRNTDGHALKPLKALGGPEIVWTTMMFDIIVDKFWRSGYQAPELSYTGEMIKTTAPLLSAVQRSNLPVVGYQQIELPPLTLTDISSDNVDYNQVGKSAGHRLRWIEDRYASQVPASILNLASTPDVHHYLPDPKTKDDFFNRLDDKQANALAVIDDGIATMPKALTRLRSQDLGLTLHSLNTTSFGTQEKLAADRAFLARANYSGMINRLAEDEFDRREEEVIAWYKERVTANAANLFVYAISEPQFHASTPDLYGDKAWDDESPSRKRIHRFSSLIGDDDYDDERYRTMGDGGVWLYKSQPSTAKPFGCHINDSVSSYYLSLTPRKASELALIAGCQIDELPDVLQRWEKMDEYKGNHILDRVDPMEWRLHSPWEQKLSFGVRIYLSKRAVAKLRKTLVPISSPVQGWSTRKKAKDD